MLGSINTGGFKKSQVDAMRDSNYFQRRKGVKGVYDAPNPKAKSRDTVVLLDSFVKNKIFPGFGKDEEGKTLQDRFMQGLKSYRPKEKTGQEKIYGQSFTDGYRWFNGWSVWCTINDAFGAPGLTVMSGGSGQPTVIQGQPR